MIMQTKNGASFYQFPSFRKFSQIQHAVFTRHVGYSRGPFSSLNISVGIGDNEAHVRKNRRIISECIGRQSIVFANQVHGNHVLIIDDAYQDTDNSDNAPALVGDAMVTNLRQIALAIQVADCQAVMMYDPNRQVVANVHVGWRGSAQNIIARTVSVMHDRFGCHAGQLVAGVGPSLGPCCAEYVNYKTEIPQRYWAYKNESHHFDFWAISHSQLVEAGMRPENIFMSRMCTKCNSDIFFSYRGQGSTGRFAAVIGLR